MVVGIQYGGSWGELLGPLLRSTVRMKFSCPRFAFSPYLPQLQLQAMTTLYLDPVHLCYIDDYHGTYISDSSITSTLPKVHRDLAEHPCTKAYCAISYHTTYIMMMYDMIPSHNNYK